MGERVLEQDLRLFFLLLGRLHLLQGPRGALRISSLTDPPRASSSPPRLGSRLASPIRYNGDLFSFLILEREESQSLAIYGGEKNYIYMKKRMKKGEKYLRYLCMVDKDIEIIKKT